MASPFWVLSSPFPSWFYLSFLSTLSISGLLLTTSPTKRAPERARNRNRNRTSNSCCACWPIIVILNNFNHSLEICMERSRCDTSNFFPSQTLYYTFNLLERLLLVVLSLSRSLYLSFLYCSSEREPVWEADLEFRQSTVHFGDIHSMRDRVKFWLCLAQTTSLRRLFGWKVKCEANFRQPMQMEQIYVNITSYIRTKCSKNNRHDLVATNVSLKSKKHKWWMIK